MNVRCDEIGADFVGGLELGAVPLAALVVATDFTSDRLGSWSESKQKDEAVRKPTILQESKVHRLQTVAE